MVHIFLQITYFVFLFIVSPVLEGGRGQVMTGFPPSAHKLAPHHPLLYHHPPPPGDTIPSPGAPDSSTTPVDHQTREDKPPTSSAQSSRQPVDISCPYKTGHIQIVEASHWLQAQTSFEMKPLFKNHLNEVEKYSQIQDVVDAQVY